jgi:hypothetical protein
MRPAQGAGAGVLRRLSAQRAVPAGELSARRAPRARRQEHPAPVVTLPGPPDVVALAVAVGAIVGAVARFIF